MKKYKQPLGSARLPRFKALPAALHVAFVGAALATSAAYAQTDTRSTAAPQSATALPEIQVTGNTVNDGTAAVGYRSEGSSAASFVEQPILDTPASIKVIPSELLVNQAVEDVAALDRFDASVGSAGSRPGWYGELSIRGISLESSSSLRYNGLKIVNFQGTGLENKERVEIFKGLSALQSGFSNPGGVINYVTKRPTIGPLSEVTLSANHYGNVEAHVDLSRRTDDERFGIRVNAAAQNGRSYVHDVKGDRTFVSLAADWKLSSSTVLQFDVEHERRKQTGQPVLWPTVTGELPSDLNPRTFRGQKWAEFSTEATIVSGKIEHFINDQWSVSAQGNWMRTERDMDAILLSNIQPNGDADIFLNKSPNQVRTPAAFRLMAHGIFKTGWIGHNLSFGVDSSDLKERADSGSFYGMVGRTNIYNPVQVAEPPLAFGPSYTTLRTTEKSAFINDVISFGDAWKLHIGGRYAMRDQKSYLATGGTSRHYEKNIFAPNVAVVFKPLSNVSTYVSYMEGLEQGGVAPIGTTNQNQQLNPLVSKQYEAGIKADINSALSIDAAVFKIDRPAEYTDATRTYVQDGESRYQGAELSLTGKLSPEWTLFASAMLLDAKVEKTANPLLEGKRAVGVPANRVSLVAEYAPQVLQGWTFSGYWTHSGSRPLNAANTGDSAPAFDVFGLGTRYNTKINGTPVVFRVHVDNLFDDQYWANSMSGYLTSGAPRTVTASVGIRF